MTIGMARSEPGPAALPAEVELRLLRPSDIAAALRLSAEAGWNQVAADWQIFLDLGEAYGLATRGDGRLIATAATLPHGKSFAWISMVLVAADCRRRGLAGWLLRYCIDRLLDRRLVPVLDATPAGRAVYLGLGFQDCWSMRRLVLHRPFRHDDRERGDDALVRPLHANDWPALLAYDRAVFGGDRQALLRRLADRLPRTALVAERSGRLDGFLLGRDGRVMTQIGPLAAEDEKTAEALLRHALLTQPSPLAIDLADRHERLGRWLIERGFAVERPLTRMLHGRRGAFDDPTRLFAVAGPEFG
jgi:GNAT superfamily N-acetyltransferase